jgi:hypothetical protein
MSRRIFGPENRVLNIMFGPKREEMSGDRRRHPNEDLQNLYPSLQKSVCHPLTLNYEMDRNCRC